MIETKTRPFRFGVINETMLTQDRWIEHVQRVEQLGYDTFLIRDHVLPDFFGDQLAPMPAIMAAACATSRLRVGTLVIDNDYRHPVMLAKEAATVDFFSGGRLELGLGAGWLRKEYEAAGIPFDRPGVRIDRLAEAIQIIKGLFGENPVSFAGEHYQIDDITGVPAPCQRPRPPLLLGGGKPRMLRLAGQEADIVSLLTTSVASGTLEEDPAERLASSVERKLEWIREGAGDRFAEIELSLIPTVLFTNDRETTAEELIAQRSWDASVDDVFKMPSVFIGDLDEIAGQMCQRRDQFRFSYYIVSDTQMEEVAPLVERLSGR